MTVKTSQQCICVQQLVQQSKTVSWMILSTLATCHRSSATVRERKLLILTFDNIGQNRLLNLQIHISCFPSSVGTLDGPVKLMEGKRERKKIERLSFDTKKEAEETKFEVEEGRGMKLGDIPNSESSWSVPVLKPNILILQQTPTCLSLLKTKSLWFLGPIS